MCMKMLKVKIKKAGKFNYQGCGLPTKLKLFSYTLYSTRKLMCELEHHRSHKKEVHLFKKSWKFMGCCTIRLRPCQFNNLVLGIALSDFFENVKKNISLHLARNWIEKCNFLNLFNFRL